MLTAKDVWKDVERIRQEAPLVHNITNYVVMNTTANALLAIGASPVMAHAAEEMEDMVGLGGRRKFRSSWIRSAPARRG